jgi:DNA-binding response OmpR family regulator
MARILLVEDDPDVRPLLEHILLSENYEVTATETAAIALALLAAQPFDLVICDVNLPDGSGLAVADQARLADVKALVITGQGLSLAPGSLAPYDYLLKPLRVGELIAAIRRRLESEDDASGVVPFPRPGS